MVAPDKPQRTGARDVVADHQCELRSGKDRTGAASGAARPPSRSGRTGGLLLSAGLALTSLAGGATTGEECRGCHTAEVENYLRTGMANSIGPPTMEAETTFLHEFSGSSFEIASSELGMVQAVSRDGLRVERRIKHVIGSGNAAFGFLLEIGDYLYQSPVSYYTKRKRWEMAPGFERHPEPEFDRPVLHECLWCHAGRPNPVAHTQNRYGRPALEHEAISCDRCHGPGTGHLASPSAETIVNPVKLPAAKRDSVCEQCHLGGEERVLNPGRSFGDFLPGMLLEEVFAVYTDDFGAAKPGRFKVVSHAEQLRLSACHRASGDRMWCGTCHDPHAAPADDGPSYRSRCLGCHGESLTDRHAPPVDDCVSCHMVRRPSFDSGHSAFTDHLIARRPQEFSETGQRARSLRAWREPPSAELATRNTGLAYLRLGQRRGREDFMDEGASLLARLAQAGRLDSEGLEALGSALLAKEAPPEAGLKELARDLLGLALEAAPTVAARHRTMAAAEWQLGDRSRAIELLGEAISLDPQNRAAYQVLARIHEESGDVQSAAETWSRYIAVVGPSILAQDKLRSLDPASR